MHRCPRKRIQWLGGEKTHNSGSGYHRDQYKHDQYNDPVGPSLLHLHALLFLLGSFFLLVLLLHPLSVLSFLVFLELLLGSLAVVLVEELAE